MDIQLHRDYYWKRTDGWKWIDGSFRWWEVFVEFLGWNGSGGYWLREKWRWNGSPQFIREQVKSLPYAESQELVAQIAEADHA